MYKGERLNSITHLMGAALALAGLIVLINQAAHQGHLMKIISFSVYGATLFTLYLLSTLYHSFRGRAKEIFQKFDHAAIYLLIAGTYTPFLLVSLEGPWGWTLFGIIWSLAVIGIVLDATLKPRREVLSVTLYIVMGWLCLVAIKPLVHALSHQGFLWLLAGGIFYTAGVVFYVFDHRKSYFHAIWHLFVLAGSVSHYFAVWLHVL
ncbi:hemolysin III family protein [Saccharophagus sp. K07]|jgi:hemolysin III|uniref:PAQR family membrane homeostasis protein TrhA n=1 Tax=Saccharophagus sp. K07 TaxID=2283636 RepID=UPI0016521659|nr:hemolysin III family protein [Saccharophagus sp. K07]MBC6906820.1 hemolysin III family protein [Saccharophagus sp. K07]